MIVNERTWIVNVNRERVNATWTTAGVIDERTWIVDEWTSRERVNAAMIVNTCERTYVTWTNSDYQPTTQSRGSNCIVYNAQ